MIQQLLTQRGIAPIPTVDADGWDSSRTQYIKALCREEYGRPLPPPTELHFEEQVPSKKAISFCAGAAEKKIVIASGTVCGKPFSFPFTVAIPRQGESLPFFVHCNFESQIPNKYSPTEEIVNRGFALLSVHYKDVTSDDGDFTNGLAGAVIPDPEHRAPDAPGKIAMWAWANMRLMDYAMTLERLDPTRSAVIGHSRLGKTALLTGMLDERFPYVISNDSGCSGAAITRGKVGEQISDITKHFPYWFCENYKKYTNHNDLTFDQHLLIAASAPRTVIVGSAEEDLWADPASEFLGCAAASPAWIAHGKKGFIAPDRLPVPGDVFDEGDICYQLRTGCHYLSRRDWNVYMDIILKKSNTTK